MSLTLPPIPPGARLELQGTCNQCGLCCTMEHEGIRLVCEHLEALTVGRAVKPLGLPLASRCRVYGQRRSGMQIAMKDGMGNARFIARCYTNTWQEDQTIAPHLGRGCSLTLPVAQGELVAFTPAKG